MQALVLPAAATVAVSATATLLAEVVRHVLTDGAYARRATQSSFACISARKPCGQLVDVMLLPQKPVLPVQVAFWGPRYIKSLPV